jgi:hypothetical protein
MKLVGKFTSLITAASCALLIASPVFARNGNGFPSGPHFNLNLIGKKSNFTCPPAKYEWTITSGDLVGQVVVAEACPTGYTCTQGPQVYGNVIFMPRPDEANAADPISILMESGAKGPKSNPTVGELQVTDWCTQSFPDNGSSAPPLGDPAVLRLPADRDGYAVYARILGKPGENGGPTFDFLSRDLVLVEDEFGNDLIALGLVTETGVFTPLGEPLTRYATGGKGKGALKATNITQLFEYSGDACYINDQAFFCPDFAGLNPEECFWREDANGVAQPVCCVPVDVALDGSLVPVTLCDGPDGFAACVDSTWDGLTYTCPAGIDFDGVDPLELACPVVPLCKTFDGAWIFNIADFVNVLFGVQNDGSYLVQIRFYPLPLLNNQTP